MKYQSIKDYILRTNENLEVIEELERNSFEKQVYETTQLINSLLALIVIPKEKHLNDIPPTPLVDLVTQGWVIPRNVTLHPLTPNLRSLIHKMRNAIAHFNIDFVLDTDETIIGIELWNITNNGVKNWEVDFLLLELRDITKRFSNLLVTTILPD